MIRYQFCGSGMFIPTNKKERGEQKNFSLPFFVATNITKFKILLFFNWWKKNVDQFTKNYGTLTYIGLGSGIQDPGSGIRKNLFRILDPASKRHRIPDPDEQRCMIYGTVHLHFDFGSGKNYRRSDRSRISM
jgi:hypothetical protein